MCDVMCTRKPLTKREALLLRVDFCVCCVVSVRIMCATIEDENGCTMSIDSKSHSL